MISSGELYTQLNYPIIIYPTELSYKEGRTKAFSDCCKSITNRALLGEVSMRKGQPKGNIEFRKLGSSMGERQIEAVKRDSPWPCNENTICWREVHMRCTWGRMGKRWGETFDSHIT